MMYIQQDVFTADGDDHRQANVFNVTCKYIKYNVHVSDFQAVFLRFLSIALSAYWRVCPLV